MSDVDGSGREPSKAADKGDSERTASEERLRPARDGMLRRVIFERT
jgi:hypothetical protein